MFEFNFISMIITFGIIKSFLIAEKYITKIKGIWKKTIISNIKILY